MRINILCTIVLFTSLVSGAEDLDSQIKKLSKAPISFEVASKWAKLSKKIEDEGLRQEVLKAASAAVIHSKRREVYDENIKSHIQEKDEFESEFYETCSKCSGEGKCDSKCLTCNGSGKCRMGNCREGTITIRRITGSVTDRCGQCRGTGICQKCGGSGNVRLFCSRCNGKKKILNKDLLIKSYKKHVEIATKWKQEREREARERREAEEKARIEAERRERERKEAEEKARIEAERRERERKEAEEKARIEAEKQENIARMMRELGLVNVRGKWMTPGSSRYVRYMVFQIYEPGHALCKTKDGLVFCLLYSAKDNRNLAEGDVLANDLYRCGTYSYITVENAPRTVRQYAIDLSVALEEIEKQNKESGRQE